MTKRKEYEAAVRAANERFARSRTAAEESFELLMFSAREARDEEIGKAREEAGLGPVHRARTITPTPLVREGRLLSGAAEAL